MVEEETEVWLVQSCDEAMFYVPEEWPKMVVLLEKQ